MTTWTIEKMRAMGMSEREIQREMCEHDYGNMCETHPFGGCVRTCIKCGQMMGFPKYCWEMKEDRERKAAQPVSEDK